MEIALLFRLSHVQVKLFSRILTDPTALMVSSPPFYGGGILKALVPVIWAAY